MDSSFESPWWLRSSHAQTVWGRLARSRRLVEFEREVLPTPDGDELVVDHLARASGSSEPALHYVLLHGLEGSSYSVYMQGMLAAIRSRGFAATAINFRFCARDPRSVSRVIPNRRPRVYHSGETGDLALVVSTLRERFPRRVLVGIGVSLGGNVLLKYLGERGAESGLARAVGVSVPLDLAAGARNMNGGAPWVYGSSFLPSLRAKALSVLERFPEARKLVDAERVRRARSMWQFDDAATSHLHGFADAADYYARSSSLQYLDRITIPTLILSSEDDPLVPREVIPRARALASPSVDFLTTRGGGHVGFVCGPPWKCRYWAEAYAVEWASG